MRARVRAREEQQQKSGKQQKNATCPILYFVVLSPLESGLQLLSHFLVFSI